VKGTEIGIKEVLEQINIRLNHVETELRGKSDRWEMRVLFGAVFAWLAAITALLGILIGKL